MVLQFDKGPYDVTENLVISNLTHRYLWGPAVDQLLADETVYWTPPVIEEEVEVAPGYFTTSALDWALGDHQGTIHDWVNNSAALVDHAIFDAYGRQIDSQVKPFNFQGTYRDSFTGLERHDKRWYNPEIGRWMSRDWIPDDYSNMYRGMGNAVSVYTDPSGLEWYYPWTWFNGWYSKEKGDKEWNKGENEERAVVQKLNKILGTSCTSMSGFTPAERGQIAGARGTATF